MTGTEAPPRGGIFARAMRGMALTATSQIVQNLLRLASNLILTRLLYPEAFGIMALVAVVLTGLVMFSDVGLGAAIAQSPRGDDPDFLDTAWTVQIVRGFLLFLAACALGWPMARFYGVPELAQILPVAGSSLFLSGFTPTRAETLARHLRLGRLVAIDLSVQVAGILVMVGVAMATGSIWALVVAMPGQGLARVVMVHWLVPGAPNRLRWDRSAAAELIGFGKWIFFSTACSFLLLQGDKAVLSLYLSLEALGRYNIAYFLASAPVMLGLALVQRVMIPLYRTAPPGASAANFARMRRLRGGLTAGLLAMLAVAALGGVWIVDLLYDDRYAQAGPILVLVALVQMPLAVGMSYDQAALAAGDSRGYFLLTALRAGLQLAGLYLGMESAGLTGGLLGQGLAALAGHLAIVALARRHRVWDGAHDAAAGVAGLAIALAALALHGPALAGLSAGG